MAPPVIADWRKCTDLPFDAHLMMDDPSRYLDDFVKAGCDVILFHIEAVPEPLGLIRRIRREGCHAGLVLNPPTPLSAIEPYLSEVDGVLVMSVMPGFGGQAFDPSVPGQGPIPPRLQARPPHLDRRRHQRPDGRRGVRGGRVADGRRLGDLPPRRQLHAGPLRDRGRRPRRRRPIPLARRRPGLLGRTVVRSMTQVILIRPGATLYDEQDRVQGVLDIPLSDRGRAEVAQLAERLRGVPLAALYCGPGESVSRTAEAVGRALGLRPKRIDELRNLDQGLWQGLQLDEIKRRNLKLFRQWLDDPRTICPPCGETVESALDRVRSALKPLIRRHRDEALGLVVGEPIAQLIAGYLRRDPHVQLDDDVPTGGFERIEVAPEQGN